MKQLFITGALVVLLLIGGGIAAKHVITGGSKTISLANDPLYTPISQALQQAYGTSQYTPIEGIDYKIRGSQYFDSNSWVVVTTEPVGATSDSLTMVLKKS